MTLKAELAPDRGVVVSLPVAFRRPLAQASIVPIGEDVAGILFDAGPQAAPHAQRLTGLLEGAPIGGPLLSTRLELRAGGQRHLLLLRRPAGALIDRAIELSLGGQPVAAIDPTWLQSPLIEGSDLIDGLSDRGRRRLLKLFLTTGASLFGFAGAPEFGRAADRLLELLGVCAVSPGSWSLLGSAGRILSYRMPKPVDPALIGDLVVLAAGSVARLKGCKLALEARAGASVLHVFAPRPLAPGAALVGLGESPVHLRAPGAEVAPQPLHAWLERRDDATRRWVCALVETEAARDPSAAALLRELRHAGAAEPALTVRHLSGTPAGLLYAADLEDPHGLIRAVRIERADATVEIDLGAQVRPGGAIAALAGFAELPRASWFDDACRIRLVHQSGRVRTVHESRPAVFAGRVPKGFAPAVRREAVEALALARLTMERPDSRRRVEDFGSATADPRFSIAVGVGDNLDLIRARAAVVFAEPGAEGVELVYHAPDGFLATAARAAIADAAAVFGLAHRLVTVDGAADPATRLLAALAAGRGAGTLALGAEVLPAGRGWLARWMRAIGPERPIVGGTLLAVDGSVIDAGRPGGAARRAAARRAAGLPGGGLPRSESAATTRVIAECVGLSPGAIGMLLTATTWHPEPDVMLAQAFARLARDGVAIRTLLRGRCVRFAEPAVCDPLTLAADARAIEIVLKRSFNLVGDEG